MELLPNIKIPRVPVGAGVAADLSAALAGMAERSAEGGGGGAGGAASTGALPVVALVRVTVVPVTHSPVA